MSQDGLLLVIALMYSEWAKLKDKIRELGKGLGSKLYNNLLQICSQSTKVRRKTSWELPRLS